MSRRNPQTIAVGVLDQEGLLARTVLVPLPGFITTAKDGRCYAWRPSADGERVSARAMALTPKGLAEVIALDWEEAQRNRDRLLHPASLTAIGPDDVIPRDVASQARELARQRRNQDPPIAGPSLSLV